MLDSENRLYVAHEALEQSDASEKIAQQPLYIEPSMANRHGLIAGATGTGKTVSLQVLAESFSDLGVPCFMADMKGDLSGVSKAGTLSKFIEKRQNEFGVRFDFQPYPTEFFDVYGVEGTPLRVTVRSFGVMLFSRIMNLTDTQEGVLNAVFRICDDKKMPLDDLKDLRAALNFVGKNAKDFQTDYGNVSSASIGAIQRNLLALEEQGGDLFFGLPEFDVEQFIAHREVNGRNKGVINILAADKLYNNPKLYSAFMMWLLTSIYDKMPEVGDMEKPKFIFFFDEAHLLFDDATKVLVEKIEKIVRLIRSKGVGVYFITQTPTDIPDNILGQLGNKVQHALRAFTPKEQKAVKAVAQSFRKNAAFDTEKELLELGTGEALISFLDQKGAPNIVSRAKMLCPQGQIGPISEEERQMAIKSSLLYKEYAKPEDRESAYEILKKITEEQQKAIDKEKAQKETEKERSAKSTSSKTKTVKTTKRTTSTSDTIVSKILVPVGRALGNKLVNMFLKKLK